MKKSTDLTAAIHDRLDELTKDVQGILVRLDDIRSSLRVLTPPKQNSRNRRHGITLTSEPDSPKPRGHKRANFHELGIPEGATLRLVENHDITCTAIRKNIVELIVEDKGQRKTRRMTLSQAAKLALHGIGLQGKAYSGPTHWMYNGQTIRSLMDEHENKAKK